jgi:hypothetical protein
MHTRQQIKAVQQHDNILGPARGTATSTSSLKAESGAANKSNRKVKFGMRRGMQV